MMGLATRAVLETRTPDRGPAADYVFTGGSLPAGVTLTRASSATRINASGVLETVASDVARFEYDPVTLACRGLLREAAATNLFPQSNLSDWGVGNITRTLNAAAGPRGTATMTKIEATTTTFTNCSTSFSAPAAVFTYSIFRKKGSGAADASNALTLYNNTTALDIGSVTINYDTGAVAVSYGNVTTRATDYGNGCWLHEITTTGVGVTAGNVCSAYVFGGGTVTAGVHAYYDCAQVEAGARATSRILTTGSAATRAADVVAVNTGCAGASECTLAMSLDLLALPASGTNFYPLGSATTGTPCFYFTDAAWAPGVYAVTALGGHPPGTVGRHKIAASIKSGDSTYAQDAAYVPVNNSGSFSLLTPATLNAYDIGSAKLHEIIERIRIWPRTMSPAELQAVTA